MHRVKHGPMDPCFFLPFFGPVGEGKRPGDEVALCPLVSPVSPVSLVFPVPPVSFVARYVPCVPCVSCVPCPLYPLCPLCSPCPVVFRVSPVLCVPCPLYPLCPLFPPCPFCHLKKMKCSVALPLFHVACGEKTSMVFFAFICWFFFRTRRRSKDVIFHENRK